MIGTPLQQLSKCLPPALPGKRVEKVTKKSGTGVEKDWKKSGISYAFFFVVYY